MAIDHAVTDRFGANLVRERRRAGISQEEVAIRASLHRTEVGMLERGIRLPRVDTLVKLAIRDLCAAGLLHRAGGLVYPSRPALYQRRLGEA